MHRGFCEFSESYTSQSWSQDNPKHSVLEVSKHMQSLYEYFGNPYKSAMNVLAILHPVCVTDNISEHRRETLKHRTAVWNHTCTFPSCYQLTPESSSGTQAPVRRRLSPSTANEASLMRVETCTNLWV